ncbi:hypothetical protein [Deinococcus cavernae]|nr:hypothetical protein [Deinococcus cavernae]
MILEVDMACVWEEGEWKVVVTSDGPYNGRYVSCSKAVRGSGVLLRGYVRHMDKIDADRRFCQLCTPDNRRSIDGFTKVFDPRRS